MVRELAAGGAGDARGQLQRLLAERDVVLVRPSFDAGSRVPAVDATAARVTGLDGAEYFDKTDGKTKRFAGELEFGGERDWVFASVAKLKLIDARRSLTFSLTGTDHVVLWNPGPEACREAPALGDEEWREFACVEPALLGRDLAGVALEPGQTAAIGMRVEVAAR